MKVTMEEDKLIQMVASGIRERFEAELKKELKKSADKAVEDVAKQLASAITRQVVSYTDLASGQIIVKLHIDGVEKAIDQL